MPSSETNVVQQPNLIEQASAHPVAQAVGGSIANAANTPIGGSSLMIGSNLAMSQVGQNTLRHGSRNSCTRCYSYIFIPIY